MVTDTVWICRGSKRLRYWSYIVLLFCFLVFATLFGDRWALITMVTWWLFSTSVSIRGFHRPLSVFVYSFCASKHILCIPACVSLHIHKVGQNRRNLKIQNNLPLQRGLQQLASVQTVSCRTLTQFFLLPHYTHSECFMIHIPHVTSDSILRKCYGVNVRPVLKPTHTAHWLTMVWL